MSQAQPLPKESRTEGLVRLDPRQQLLVKAKEAAHELPKETARSVEIIILERSETGIYVGAVKATRPRLLQISRALEVEVEDISVREITPEVFESLFKLVYEPPANTRESYENLKDFFGQDEKPATSSNYKSLLNFKLVKNEGSENHDNLARLGEKKAQNALEMGKMLVRTGYSVGASDIHITQGVEFGTIHMRIDGTLQPVFGGYDFSRVDNQLVLQIITALAQMGGIDFDKLTRLPQDAAFDLPTRDKTGALKQTRARFASTPIDLPIADGKGVKATIRLNENVITDLDKFGLEPEVIGMIKNAVKKIGGLMFIVGGTGSGKSNLLAAIVTLLHQNAKGGINIMGFGDTIEFHLPGFIQTKTGGALTDAAVVKSYLRHDPDVLIGNEIRDEEALVELIKLATSGKLVISTLHTDSLPGVFLRLIKLGVDREEQAQILRSVVFTALPRMLCNNCKIPVVHPEALPGEHMADPKGCPECRYLGYKGRTSVTESLTVSNKIAHLIQGFIPVGEICEHAIASGDLFPVQEAIRRKIEAGITSREEIGKRIDLEKRQYGGSSNSAAQSTAQTAANHPFADAKNITPNAGNQVEAPVPPDAPEVEATSNFIDADWEEIVTELADALNIPTDEQTLGDYPDGNVIDAIEEQK